MAQMTRAEIADRIADLWPTNVERAISAQDLRDVVSSLAASVTWHDEAGSGDGGERYVHAQTAASTVWTIVHNFGQPPGSVRLLDATGAEIVGSGEDVDANTYRIEWASPLAGSAILLG